MEENLPSLHVLADDSTHIAAGLHTWAQRLPQCKSDIAAIVSELFAISAVLQRIHQNQPARSHASSSHHFTTDLSTVLYSLRITMDDIFAMFASAAERSEQKAWDDLMSAMEKQEMPLLDRLQLSRDLSEILFDIMSGEHVRVPRNLRQMMTNLLAAQQRARSRRAQHPDEPSNPHFVQTTPRPRRTSRPPRVHTPSVVSEEYVRSYGHPPVTAPEPPLAYPISPTSPLTSPTFTNFSSASSRTMSSHTSHSSNPFTTSPQEPLIHWAQSVFNGSMSATRYRTRHQLLDTSKCYGDPEPNALVDLSATHFQPMLEIPFDENQLRVRFYWRPEDHSARILLQTHDRHAIPTSYCAPLTSLRVVRKSSTLLLCRINRHTQQCEVWARLNFLLHERMVLFASTLIAMKHQDTRGIPHRALLDRAPLLSSPPSSSSSPSSPTTGEDILFAGQIRHDDMLHALRLYRDHGSRLVRLEASPLRGSRQDVPLWTAFVSRYVGDPDWACWEGDGVVSLAALRPPPFVFVPRLELQRAGRGRGDFLLPFTTDADAKEFMATWAGVCQKYGKH